MKIVIDYNPSADEVESAIIKGHRSAIRTRYSILADHEILKTTEAIKQRIAEAIAKKKPLELEVSKVFAQYGPDALDGEDE